jgi:hypothetical protein
MASQMVTETYALKKLKEAEVVLMRKIKRLQDGKPKWTASKELDEVREAIHILSSNGIDAKGRQSEVIY